MLNNSQKLNPNLFEKKVEQIPIRKGFGEGLVVAGENNPNVVGLRDSVLDKSTGLVCDENTPENMAEKITELFFDQNSYNEISKNALEFSKGVNFEKSFSQFIKIINE
jgi:glycosyltransferase involved in cell wall biosynthesis